MIKTLFAAAALALLATSAAVAESKYPNLFENEDLYPTTTWDCGDVEITLHKNMVHDQTLTVRGKFSVWSPDGKPLRAFDLKWVGDGGAIFNGKRCTSSP